MKLNKSQKEILEHYINIYIKQSHINNFIENKKDKNFVDYEDNISRIEEDIKKKINSKINTNTKGEEASYALEYFHKINKKLETSIEYSKVLIDSTYYANWSPELQKYYIYNRKILLDYKYNYFISFTRSNPKEDYISQINIDYKDYIQTILSKQEYKSDNTNMNLLARAIDIHIQRMYPQLNGFLDEEVLPNSDKKKHVDEVLKKACENTLVFIQIINNHTFIQDNKSAHDNYCFKEFKFVQNGLETQFEYLVAEGNRKLMHKCEIFEEHEDWYDSITGPYHIILDKKNIDKKLEILFKKIKNIIPNIIDGAKEY